MRAYLDLLRRVLKEGSPKNDRTGTGTHSLFGESLSFDMTQGFPLITTKKIYIRSMIYELLWFLRGEDHIGFLKKHKVGIWDAWADEDGYLGPTYGVQWRAFPAPDGTHVDQIARAVEMLCHQPDSRRIVVSAWNPTQVDQTVLPPCHCFFQFYVDHERRLSCALYQRSADLFLGVPFNIASYALLTAMIAQVTNLKPHKIKLFFGDVHLYNNHVKQVREQLTRKPYTLPRLVLDKSIKEIDSFTFSSIAIHDYQHHDALSAPISV